MVKKAIAILVFVILILGAGIYIMDKIREYLGQDQKEIAENVIDGEKIIKEATEERLKEEIKDEIKGAQNFH